jgi:hypothetical protein
LSGRLNQLTERNTLNRWDEVYRHDVHKESLSIGVLNSAGKLLMECVIGTKATMILQLVDGLRGDSCVRFEAEENQLR